ncbi:MAG: hypothetical protein AAGA75_18950 [Cyanobacteria bacterium P01_E01_bin.6]
MKLQHVFRATAFAGTLAASLLINMTAVQADTISTPISNTFTVQGSSGGTQNSQCGYISATPNHQLVITERLVALRFTVEGEGQPTLAIQDEQGRIECVMSHQFSNGIIELPGAWEAGRYNIFIGDRTGGNHRYTLSVIQER